MVKLAMPPRRAAGAGAVRSVAALATAFLAALATGCTYHASFADCEIACHAPTECPVGFVCGNEGLCRLATASAACADVLADANIGSDGSSNARCTGTAATCAGETASAACTGLAGCAWTPPACTLTSDCASIQTNTQCMATPGCATDFTTSTCKPIAGYCSGSSKAACEMTQACAFTGGCSGTAVACTALASQTSCQMQAGCSWH